MNADDSSRHAQRVFWQFTFGTAVTYYVLRYVIGEEVQVDKAGDFSRISRTPPEARDQANDEPKEDDKVDEDDVQVPETMPEDAFFIPLGRVRQLPHTHYKGSDPEWQSFVEFGQNRERPAAVRSTLASSVIETDI